MPCPYLVRNADPCDSQLQPGACSQPGAPSRPATHMRPALPSPALPARRGSVILCCNIGGSLEETGAPRRFLSLLMVHGSEMGPPWLAGCAVTSLGALCCASLPVRLQ